MKLLSIVTALTTILTAASSATAQPEVTLRAGGLLPFTATVEGTVGWAGSPWSVTGQASILPKGASWVTLTGQYAFPLGDDASWGLFAGLNQTWVDPVGGTAWQELVHRSFGATLGAEPMKILGGAFYQRSWDKLRLRLSPSVSYLAPLTGAQRYPWLDLPEAALIGPAWVELGYRVTPSLEFGLRSNLVPLVASYRF